MTEQVQPLPKKSLSGCQIVGVIIAVLVVIGMLSGKGETGDGATQATAGQPSTPPVEVTARELAAAFDANEVAAQAQYGKGPLLVSGTVQGVTLDAFDNAHAQLAGVNEFLPVSAKLDDKAAAASLAKGAKVRLLCASVSEVISSPQLSDCVLQP